MNLNDVDALPDLLPEDLMFSDLLPVDGLAMPAPYPDFAEWGRKIDNLIIECNTLNLRLEVEKSKRQRLQSTVRQIKRDMVIPCPDLTSIQRDFDRFKEQQNTANYIMDGENARTNTLAFRSISRICQFLTTMLTGASSFPDATDELNVLLHELSLTIRQFGVHYAASHV